jgi:hypothetical protein
MQFAYPTAFLQRSWNRVDVCSSTELLPSFQNVGIVTVDIVELMNQSRLEPGTLSVRDMRSPSEALTQRFVLNYEASSRIEGESRVLSEVISNWILCW